MISGLPNGFSAIFTETLFHKLKIESVRRVFFRQEVEMSSRVVTQFEKFDLTFHLVFPNEKEKLYYALKKL